MQQPDFLSSCCKDPNKLAKFLRSQINALVTRLVLLNLDGEEKTPDEIRALIKKTYGIEQAKTMDQMLYKRASKGTMFYKTAEGRFGLLALRATTEDVRTPTTAVA